MLTEEQDDHLERLAAARHVSKAELVRRAVNLLLQQQAGSDTDGRWCRMLSVMAGVHGDGAPVSEEHDRFLASAYAGRGDWMARGTGREGGAISLIPRGPTLSSMQQILTNRRP